ncbi:MAG: response regulator [Anaerolineaceae bacterium]|nr:response regulator [Anaerolineaceae bacterium]
MIDPKITAHLDEALINDTSKWTVLIVDDEPDNREIAHTVLSFAGVKVHTAVHGEDGLKLLEEIVPTFILLDLSMPVMDGWEMLAKVRTDPKTQHIPVIALTAHAMAGDRERAFEAGFDGYIPKPFRIGSFLPELIGCLQKVIERNTEQVVK